MLVLLAHHGSAALSTPYANEATNIAASIASGHGFASPLSLVRTGPTAWLCPVFPYLVGGIFRLFGIFSARSLLAIQALNCLFASLTVFPIHAMAKRSFGSLAASLAAWLWVFLPFAWWTPIQDVWETALTGFLFASIIWSTIAIRESARPSRWLAYGALWAAAALVNPAPLSVFPLFLVWLTWPATRFGPPKRLPSLALVTCGLLLLPWSIRNQHVLGKWVPLRSNFGLELWLGNNLHAADVNSFALHPLWNSSEAAQFQRGEAPYFAAKQRDALGYMHSHPGAALRSLTGRVWLNWFAVTDRPRAHWSALPRYLKALFLANFLMILLGGLALILFLRTSPSQAMPYLIVLAVFPVPYYLTHTLVRYRFPLEPVLAILSVWGALQLWESAAKYLREQAARAARPVETHPLEFLDL